MICSSLSPLCIALEMATKSEMAAWTEIFNRNFPVGSLQWISLAFKILILHIQSATISKRCSWECWALGRCWCKECGANLPMDSSMAKLEEIQRERKFTEFVHAYTFGGNFELNFRACMNPCRFLDNQLENSCSVYKWLQSGAGRFVCLGGA